jgi:hypothetical protein
VRGSVRRHNWVAPVFNAEASCNIVSKAAKTPLPCSGLGILNSQSSQAYEASSRGCSNRSLDGRLHGGGDRAVAAPTPFGSRT